MTQNDPTDHALAAIASILDHSHEKPDSKAEVVPLTEVAAAAVAREPAVLTPEIDVDSYSKLGPGPLDAIRFRWTARRDDEGQYFVDETIGPSSRPLVLGPMPRHEIVGFIDAREASARRRFEALKNEMTFGKRMPDYDREANGES
ncbi:hypothetical protein FNL55_15375 [Tardiphaga sp. vice352]|uniref:hypothetical protein n=1 Tax=unclassified Tardiphaga TaxID=2631404 RepID=UPI001163EDCB|nr:MULTISPECIES: hypothetical protein [unclassified Tardiphaga]MBC7583827.1 hypothetical protein [Tardiphaga sp.]QDM17215.1 hypothetical protein FNL53_15655 [Tardiphaga sp. vice278]QDM22198.1 hypothetical protein FIU28_14310 [Tardiphaga sp. vice154]QDM27451.1 hypothetical protein FNL56_15975 [Tardiphaga sp. vice304]QDM32578.1 hypothetical protein FNL55_15375 [Tardiphaga sp. vice352]